VENVATTIGVDYFFVVIAPLWIMAGFADWVFHRRTRIESTSGLPESLLHIAMLGEVGLPALAGVFFEFNALVLALMLGGLGLHTLTTYADLRYSHPRREISPGEQMAHSLLEVLPLFAVSLAIIDSWPAILSLINAGDQAPDFRLRLREVPLLDPPLGIAFAIALFLFVFIPYSEELWRTLRSHRRTH
jgi:hypothetical protein